MADALQMAQELDRIYDTSLTNNLVKVLLPDVLLTNVRLLCVTCQQPIKACITTSQWIRVEWISSEGKCQVCAKENGNK